jgi:hypothetical protein
LESILRDNRFNEFSLFYRLCHRSRFPGPEAEPTECVLENYYQQSVEQGGRVREHLRDGVEKALTILGTGFLRHPDNSSLRERLTTGRLAPADYHRQLLRLIYRFLFLMVAEERGLVVSTGQGAERRQAIYHEHYSVSRLRERAEQVVETSVFADLWMGLQRSFALFCYGPDDNPLGIPPLNGDLFSKHATEDLDGTHLYNHDLLVAVRHISTFRANGAQQRVNYSALDVEELGSVYESLLDSQPAITELAGGPAFELREGSERKTTGSYYTRPELVYELIESALVPVMEERLATAGAPGHPSGSGVPPRGEGGSQRADEQATIRAAKDKAILSMTVCDPACGSGHFLLAAARRLGRELAKIQTGEEEPTPEAFHLGVRDVIAHSIYGVDVNPLAVDLCKLALWLEGHWTGKPLSFLDHHIKCGNSLIGVFNPEALKQGIPDDAFNPVTGDDKKAAGAFKKRNRRERESPTRRLPFERTALGRLEDLAHQVGELSEVAEKTPADVKRKAELYRRIYESPESHRTHRAGNLWTAAFFTPLQPEDPRVPTSESLWEWLEGHSIHGQVVGQADGLAGKHRFFHWFLEFPEVFAKGGFDVVLGNPPWERINLREEEFFATRAPEIAACGKKSDRRSLILGLATDNPELWKAYREALRDADMLDKSFRSSGRFPLTGSGDINTYAVFAELAKSLVCQQGRAGILLPIGIATDDTTKAFFGELVGTQVLVKLIGFENEAFIFPAVHHSFKFCALTFTGGAKGASEAEFSFFCRRFGELGDARRRFNLSPTDIAVLNPNTRTCPIFRTRADAELTKKIYGRVRVLVDERSASNAWRLVLRRMFHMADDSSLFHAFQGKQEGMTSSSEAAAAEAGKEWVRLYEAKMFNQFDHRYGTYEGATQAQRNVGTLPQPAAEKKADPAFLTAPRYSVALDAVRDRFAQWNREEGQPIADWRRTWLLAFRDITSAVVDRTAIFSIVPRTAVGHTAPLALFSATQSTGQVACFLANVNSIPFDYVARQKVGGTHLTYGILNQLPVVTGGEYAPDHVYFIVPRVLELTYTAWDIKGFADDLWRDSTETVRELIRCRWENNKTAVGGHEFNPPDWVEITEDDIPLAPFRWNEDRRGHIRAELDAYYALLYGLTRDELRYILDPKDVYGPDFPGETFRVLKEKEEKQFGEYRTRRLVLEAFDKLAESPQFRDDLANRTSELDRLQRPGKGVIV